MMGRWTDVILSLHPAEEDIVKIDEVNKFFEFEENTGITNNFLKQVDCLGNFVYAATNKSFNLDGFTKHLAAIDWAYPAYVQLFVKEDDEQRFTLHIKEDHHE